MTEINIAEDCGNSPRKLFLKEFNTAFAENDLEFILDNVDEDIYWNMVGEEVIEGKNSVAEALEEMKDEKTAELTVNNIITHGNTAASDGTLKLENGKTYAFCDVYRFSSHSKDAKISEMTSYVIQIDD